MVRGSQTRIRATAIHEAGHALAALKEGRQLLEVNVSSSCPGSGQTVWRRASDQSAFRLDDPVIDIMLRWRRMLQVRLSDIRITLAGPLAEAKALNQPLRSLGARSDLSICHSVIHSMTVRNRKLQELAGALSDARVELPTVNMTDLVNEQRRRVRRWLGRPTIWQAIISIADRLVEEGSLRPGEVLQAYLRAHSKQQAALPLDWPDSSLQPDVEN